MPAPTGATGARSSSARSSRLPTGPAGSLPRELGLSYRHSSLQHGQVVAAVEYRLTPREESEIRATVRDLVARRKATQPTTKRTFGSVFKNPPGELGAGAMLEQCGLKGHRIGGALISPKHANFIENAGDATTADCLALMAEARRRAREQFGVELEHEVVLLGDIPSSSRGQTSAHIPPHRVGACLRAAKSGRWPPGDESNVDRVPVRVRRMSSSRFRGGSPASASIWPGSSPRAALSGSPS